MFRRRSNQLDKNNSRHGTNHELNLSISSLSKSASSVTNNNNNNNKKVTTTTTTTSSTKISSSPTTVVTTTATTSNTNMNRKPIKGILRITSLNDSLHSVYGSNHQQRNLSASTTAIRSSTKSNNSSSLRWNPDHSIRSSVSDSVVQYSNNNIMFHTIEIREYKRTVGDNPSCSSGPPVSISWEYYPDSKVLSLDDYENYKTYRRASYEMILSREERDRMLRNEWDVSRAEIANAIRESIRVKNQRRQTVQNISKDDFIDRITSNRNNGSSSTKLFSNIFSRSQSSPKLSAQGETVSNEYMNNNQYRQQQLQQWKESENNVTNNNNINNRVVVVTKEGDYDDDDDDSNNNVDVDVGLDIDDDEEVTYDDNEGISEHKEDYGSSGYSSTNNKMRNVIKKNIVIHEDDDDDHDHVQQQQQPTTNEIIVGKLYGNNNNNTSNSIKTKDSDNGSMDFNEIVIEHEKNNYNYNNNKQNRNPTQQLLPPPQQQQQYKGETSSEDGNEILHHNNNNNNNNTAYYNSASINKRSTTSINVPTKLPPKNDTTTATTTTTNNNTTIQGRIQEALEI